MKLYKIFAIILTVGFSFSACNTTDLQELNIDPLAASKDDMDPGFVLAWSQLKISGERYENWRAQLIYQSTMMQIYATLPGYWSGDKYFQNNGYASSLWDRSYGSSIKNLVDMINNTSPETVGDNSLINYHAIGRIMKAFVFLRLTDLHGDVPYSEAGLGFLENKFTPVYDTQEEIYTGANGLIAEISGAIAQLDASQLNPGVQDLCYGGDLDKWRKAGNSLLLRIGMRMSKVNPTLAQSTVSAALSAGVMEGNDDMFKINHTDGPTGDNMNGIGEVFNYNGERYANDDSPRLSETLVNWMRAENDPRLASMSWVVDGSGDQYDRTVALADALGMPNGNDATTIQNDPNYVDATLNNYSRIKPDFVLRSSPMVFQSYAEVCFLYAEAFERGWQGSAPGDAATWYANGIRAAMDQIGMLYGAAVAVPTAETDAYIAAHPYSGGEAGLEEIGEQVWIATFGNFYETWANWRRTGYPQLTPVNFPGNVTEGQIPRRLTYNQGEAANNSVNYSAAVSRLGGLDDLRGRVWWDVQ